MPSFRSILILSIAFILPNLLEGCVALVVGGAVGGAAAGGYAAGQERGITGQYDDFKTRTNVQLAIAAMRPPVAAEIGVDVYEGRTLLTGTAPSPAAKEVAADAARRAAGVRALYDEVEVRAPESVWDQAKDAWITTELRTRLTFDRDIRSLNYTIATVDGAVYLLGSARTEAELGRATGWARNIPGVRRVVSFVEIRPGAALAQEEPPPGTGQGPSSLGPEPPETGQSPASLGPPPPAPVEIHPLSSTL